MRNSSDCQAFTLIEVLIVVIIMAVLAATIIPQFSTSTQMLTQPIAAGVTNPTASFVLARTRLFLFPLVATGAGPVR